MLTANSAVDIINVVSVTSLATVDQMIEDNDDEQQNALYWRQALDIRTKELSVRSFNPLASTPYYCPPWPAY